MVQVFTKRCFRTDCILKHASVAGLLFVVKCKGKKKNPTESLLFGNCCHAIEF